MSRMVLLFICFFLVSGITSSLASPDSPSDPVKKGKIPRIYNDASDLPFDVQNLHTTAYTDTYLLAEFTFDGVSGGDAEGWTGVDVTRQAGNYFHVDDFSGLSGGDFGRLTPLAGSKSLWCGMRPETSGPFCGYAALPGYANFWDQCTGTVPLLFRLCLVGRRWRVGIQF